MKLFIILSVLLFNPTVWAAGGLPRIAVAHLQLDQPTVRIQFPEVNFKDAEYKKASGLVTYATTGSVQVGSVSYDMDKKSFVVLKDDSKPLQADNIKYMQYRLFSPVVGKVVATIIVELETGNVTLKDSNIRGVVTQIW